MTRGARQESLSRCHRFSGRGAFAAALRSPRKVRTSSAILHVAPGTPGCSRFGLVLPKRLVRLSTDRNRMKRLAREAFRRHAIRQAGLDLVLAPRVRPGEGAEADWVAQVNLLLGRAAVMV